jgi:hypothetical protein
MKEQQPKKTAREVIDDFVGHVGQLVSDLDESGASAEQIIGGFAGRYAYGMFPNLIMNAVVTRRNVAEATRQGIKAPIADPVQPQPQVKERVPRRFFRAVQPL